ncbi:hypothetical protein VNI00_013158 [Paramarasmius palmivorus]|uniref:Uncharacterized protein n=1 Tax=Paramarasmius palmivorus TaxID=297713 RepID=A0AAW0C3I8_9AGAR
MASYDNQFLHVWSTNITRFRPGNFDFQICSVRPECELSPQIIHKEIVPLEGVPFPPTIVAKVADILFNDSFEHVIPDVRTRYILVLEGGDTRSSVDCMTSQVIIGPGFFEDQFYSLIDLKSNFSYLGLPPCFTWIRPHTHAPEIVACMTSKTEVFRNGLRVGLRSVKKGSMLSIECRFHYVETKEANHVKYYLALQAHDVRILSEPVCD